MGLGDRTTLRVKELELARRQFGVVSRRQLLEIGLSRWIIDEQIENQTLVPVWSGVYAVGHDVLSPKARWLAATLTTHPPSTLSHDSAAALWGLLPPRPKVHVLRSSCGRKAARPSSGTSSILRNGLVIHRTRNLDPTEVTEHEGIRVTTVGRTLADQAGRKSSTQIMKLITEAERARIFHLEDVLAACERGNGRRGTRKLRRAIEDWNSDLLLSRSDLEDKFWNGCHAVGMPEPDTNLMVEGFEADFYWPRSKLNVEVDGYVFHGDRRSFESDRHRDLVLQSAGYRVVRITDRALRNDDGQLFRRLRSLITRGENSSDL